MLMGFGCVVIWKGIISRKLGVEDDCYVIKRLLVEVEFCNYFDLYSNCYLLSNNGFCFCDCDKCLLFVFIVIVMKIKQTFLWYISFIMKCQVNINY